MINSKKLFLVLLFLLTLSGCRSLLIDSNKPLATPKSLDEARRICRFWHGGLFRRKMSETNPIVVRCVAELGWGDEGGRVER
jgi:hypothetical protein